MAKNRNAGAIFSASSEHDSPEVYMGEESGSLRSPDILGEERFLREMAKEDLENLVDAANRGQREGGLE